MKIFTVNLFTLFSLFLFIQNIDAQCPAGMAADAGTSTMTIPAVNGGAGGGPGPNGAYIFCFGDDISIVNNGDTILPPPSTLSGTTWFFYTCAPTQDDVSIDPCYTNSGWGPTDFVFTVDGLVVNFLGGVNHFWIAPGTYDNSTTGSFNIDDNADGCFDVSLTEAYELYFLNEIQFSSTNDDCNGTCTVTITGGYPEFFLPAAGGTYTVINTGPGTLTQSGAAGEIITITGLANNESCSFDITDDGNGCTDNFFGSPINLNMDDPTFAFDAFCAGETNGPTGIVMLGGTFAFNPPAGDGATIDPNTGVISDGIAGNSYSVEYTVGVCMRTSTVNVTPITLPPTPVINPNPVTLCPGENTLISPSGVGSVFNFYTDPPPVGFLTTNSVFDPATFLTAGMTRTFYVTETVGTCEGPATSVDITLLAVLTPPTLNPDNLSVCLGANVTITPSANNGEVNPVFNFYSDAALSNLLSTGIDYTFTANNDTQIWVTEEINPCESSAVVFTLTITPPPAQLVINDEIICLNDAIPDVSAAGNGGTINWYNSDPTGGGVPPIATGNPFSPPVNSSIISTTTFWVTETNATGCESIPTAFNIIVQAAPGIPNAVSPPNICVGDVIPDLTANGSGGTLNWYDSDPSIGNPAPIGSGSPFSPAINSNVAGIFDFWVTETNANSCEGLASQVSITIESTPAPPTVVQPNPICLDDAPPSVTANGSGGTINWYDSDPSIGNPVPIGSGSPFMPLVNTSIAGNIPIWVTETSATGCESTATTFNIIVEAPPGAPNVVSPATICIGDPIPNLTANGTGGTLNWYDSDPSFGNPPIIGSGSPFSPAINSNFGATFNFWVSETSANNCESAANQVSIIVEDAPAAPTVVQPNPVCLNTVPPTLTANGAGGIITWYDSDPAVGNPIPIGVGSPFMPIINTNIAGTTTLWVTETNNNNCESTAAMVLITVNVPPSAPVTNSIILICVNDPTPSLFASGAGGTIFWYNTDPAIGSPAPIGIGSPFVPIINTSSEGNLFIWVTEQDAAGCESSTSQISITISPLPVLADVQLNCSADLLSYTVVITLTVTDNISVSEGTVADNGGGSFTISGVGINNNLTVTANNSISSCSDDFTITAPDCNCPTVDAPINGGDMAICDGDLLPTLSVTVGAGETVNWYDAATGGTLLAANTTTFTPTAAGTYFAETEITSSGCTSLTRTAVMLTINPLPVLSSTQTDCSADLLTYTATLIFINATDLIISEGTLTDNGGGSFTISGIDVNNDLTVTASNATTSCSDDFIITAPDCNCPTVNAPVSGGDAEICEGDILPSLNVTVGAGETVDWYDAATGGTLLAGDMTTFTPTAAGTYFAETREISSGCTSLSRTAVMLTINPLPILSSTQTDCSVDLLMYTATLIFANATDLVISEGTLVDNGSGSFTISGIDINNDLTVTASNLTTSCMDDFTITPPDCNCPTVDAPVSGGDVDICEGDAFPTLSATVGIGETIDWYDAAVDGTLLASNIITFTPSAAGTYFAETRETSSDCTSSTRTAVMLTINPLPTLSSTQTDCSADLLMYTATLVFANATDLVISEGTLVDNGSGSFTISDIDINNDLTVTASNSTTSCTDDFTITPPDCNCPTVDAPVSGGNIAICEGDAFPTLSATVGIGETIDWYDAAVDGTLLASSVTTFTPSAVGTYFAEMREISSDCTSSTRTAITLSINPLPTLNSTATDCSADLQTYTATLVFTNATNLIISEGSLVDNGGGSFTISSIDINNALSVTASNSTTSCADDFTIPVPTCSCPNVDPPISGGDAEICEGDVLPTLGVTVEVGETVDWYDAAVDGILLASNTTTFTPTAAGIYFAETRVINSACTSLIRTAVTLTINENPILSIADLSHPGCGLSNGSITLNASGGQAPYTYQMGNNSPQNSPIFMPLAAATYSFSVQDNNTCVSTLIDATLIEPLGPTSVISGLDTLTCALTAFQLDAAASSGDGGLNFEWIYNNETISNDIILSVSESGMYILIVHQDACMDSDTVFVEEILASNIMADIQSETALDCNISSVILDGTGSSSGINITYAWFFNGSLISGEENNTYQASAAGLYTIQVTDNVTGCIATADYNLIDNNAFPVANAGEDGELNCITESVLLDGSASQSGLSIVYQWFVDGVIIPNATTNTWTVSLPGIYTLEVQDTTNGCTNEDIMLVTTDYILPVVEAGENDNLGCQEESLNLDGEGSAAGAQFSYNWSVGNTGTILSGGNTLSPTIGSAGQYWLTVTNTENGCIASDSIAVGQIESIETSISVATQDVECFGESNGSISLAAADPTAQIVYAVNQADFVTNSNFFNLEAGVYDIIAEDVNGCQWDTIIVIEAGVEMLVDLEEDQYIHLGDSVRLNGLINISEDAVASIKWTNADLLNCPDCLDTYTVPLQFTTTFELTVSDQNGCSDSDIITVYVDKTRNVFIPNAFSPNGDGINDLLVIYSDNDVVNVKQFSIFDRWGENLFEASNFQPNSQIYGWDGNYRDRPLNSGVYIYLIEIEFLDGETEMFSGDVILIR